MGRILNLYSFRQKEDYDLYLIDVNLDENDYHINHFNNHFQNYDLSVINNEFEGTKSDIKSLICFLTTNQTLTPGIVDTLTCLLVVYREIYTDTDDRYYYISNY